MVPTRISEQAEAQMSLTGDGTHKPGNYWREYFAAVPVLGGRTMLAAILVLGFLLRVAWMATEAPVISSDGAEYARMAEHLFHDHALVGNFEGPEIMYAPLYPVLIAGAMWVIPNSEAAAHLVALVSGTALIGIVFLIARNVYGRRIAYICALLTSVHPLLVALSGSIYNESLYVTLLMAVVYWGLRALDLQRRRYCLLLGVCIGLAYLTRVEAFAYVLFFVPALVIAGLLRRAVRPAVVGSLILVASFFTVASPYVAFFYKHTGSLRLEAKWDMNYATARSRLAGKSSTESDYGVDMSATMKGPTSITINGPMLAPNELWRWRLAAHSPTLSDKLGTLVAMANYNRWAVYYDFLSGTIGSPVLLGLVIIGLLRQPWSNRRLRHEGVLLVMATSVAIVVLISSSVEFRYFFPILPLLLLWSGKGLDELGQWIQGWEVLTSGRFSRPRLIAVAVQLCAVVPLLLLSTRGVIKESLFVAERNSTALAARDAGLWLADHEPGPKRVAVRHAVIPYYSKGTLIGLPYADSETTLRYLAMENVDFVVLTSDHARVLPTISDWIAHGIPDARARLIYDRTNPEGDRVVIYRWAVGPQG